MAQNPLDPRNPKTKKYSSKELGKWLIDKAMTAAGNSSRKVVLSNDPRKRDSTVIGRLYFFKYDPKWKHKLAKYDMFPLVFPIEMYEDGFLGLNLHYLSMGERFVLLSRLTAYQNNQKLDSTTRLKLSYQLIASTKKLNSLTRPCIKRYLYGHVRSKFIEVYADEYDRAIQLPVEDWVFAE